MTLGTKIRNARFIFLGEICRYRLTLHIHYIYNAINKMFSFAKLLT